jgi:hypothetical protein
LATPRRTLGLPQRELDHARQQGGAHLVRVRVRVRARVRARARVRLRARVRARARVRVEERTSGSAGETQRSIPSMVPSSEALRVAATWSRLGFGLD